GLADFVFHHRQGKRIQDFARSWARACREANMPGKRFHDFRRTAVRDLTRSGTPQSVAMAITGHETVSVFLRYNITTGDDMRNAINKMENYRAAQAVGNNVRPFPHSSRTGGAQPAEKPSSGAGNMAEACGNRTHPATLSGRRTRI